MTMMVALVGGQALPNLLPARFYRPSSMLLVYTQTTKEKYERLKTALEQETIIYGLETDAYNIVKITEVLNQKLDNPEFTTQALLFLLHNHMKYLRTHLRSKLSRYKVIPLGPTGSQQVMQQSLLPWWTRQ